MTNDQNAVNATQKKLDDAKQSQSGTAVTNTIKIPAGYTTGLIDQEKDPNKSAEVQQQTIKGMVASYKHDPSAEKQDVNPDDLDNLPSNYQTELNNFVLGVVNSVRKQMGLSPLTVTEGSMKLAHDVAEKYGEDNWQIFTLGDNNIAKTKGHDVSGLDEVAKQDGMAHRPAENSSSSIFGMKPSQVQSKDEIVGAPIPETLNDDGWSYNIKMLSSDSPLIMDDLEEYAYYSIMSMLFADKTSYFAHAANLTEQNGDMGVSYGKLGQLHIEFYDPSNHGNLGTTPITSSTSSSSALQQQISDLQNQLTQQQNKVKADQDKVNADKQVVANDQNQIKQDTPAGLENQLQNDQQNCKMIRIHWQTIKRLGKMTSNHLQMLKMH